jgi:hypothetical protein
MRELRTAAAVLAFALVCGCASGSVLSGDSATAVPSGPSSAVVFEKRVFKLSKTPNPEIEAGLQDALDGAFSSAVRSHSGEKPMEIGFTYTVSPKGAIYPFSEVEVACLMQEKYRSKGVKLCRDFFAAMDTRIKTLTAAPAR